MAVETLYEVFHLTTAHRTAEERNTLFHATARRLQRLNRDPKERNMEVMQMREQDE